LLGELIVLRAPGEAARPPPFLFPGSQTGAFGAWVAAGGN